MVIKIIGITTKVYRVALIVTGAIGAALALVNSTDLTDPSTQIAVGMGLVTIVITMLRQVLDSTTPTLP